MTVSIVGVLQKNALWSSEYIVIFGFERMENEAQGMLLQDTLAAPSAGPSLVAKFVLTGMGSTTSKG